MSIESALYSYLTGVSAVTTLVSTRIYTGVTPEQTALPRVIQQRISQRRFPHVSGSSGMVRTRQQIDVFGATQGAVDAIVEALRTALDGWRNAVMGTEELNVLSVNMDDVRYSYQQPSDASDIGVHRASIDFIILHGESVPTF